MSLLVLTHGDDSLRVCQSGEEGGTQCPTAAHTCVFVSKDNVCESSQICELEAENVRRKGSVAKIA